MIPLGDSKRQFKTLEKATYLSYNNSYETKRDMCFFVLEVLWVYF